MAMTDFEQGFRDALRRIDVMDAPVGIDPVELTRRSEAARRRRLRVRVALVAAITALVATAVGFAGLFSGGGRAGPVVGVPVEPEPRHQVVVDPPPAEPGPGTEVVVSDPDKRGGVSERAVFVDGNTVYLADPVADEIRVYRDGRKVDTLRTPRSLYIVDLAVRDDVFYVIDSNPGLDHDNAGRKLGALARMGDGLAATDLLPDGLVNAEPVSLVRLGQALAVVDVFGQYSLLAGDGPLPEPPSIGYHEGDRVQLQDGQIDAVLHTRPGQTVVRLLARDAAYAWYEVATTAADDTVDDVVHQFALAGDLVATWSGGRTTVDAGAHGYAVDGGQVYQLVDTRPGVQVVRLQPSPSGSPLPSATTLPDGFRRVQYDTIDTGQRVELGVPESWGEAYSPPADYCFRDSFAFPGKPYVDTNHGTDQRHASACPALTASRQAAHVTITDPSAITPGPPWDGDTPGWRQWSATVGGVVVTVTGRTSDATLAQQILATVRVT
jgi:hypothetical protein